MQDGKRRLRIDLMTRQERQAVAEEFGVPADATGMAREMRRRRLGQADVALLFLSVNQLDTVERVCGVRVRVMMPAVPPHRPRPVRAKPREGDDRRFVWVAPMAYRGNKTVTPRFEHVVKGRTIAEFLKRGGTRRDLRNFKKWGLVKVENDG